MKPRKRIKRSANPIKPGKKAKRNARVNRELKKNAVKQDLPLMCELQLPGCTGAMYPSWAHSKIRNLCKAKKMKIVPQSPVFLATPKQRIKVILKTRELLKKR